MQNLSPDVIAPADIQTPEVVVALPVKLLFAGGLGTIAISLAITVLPREQFLFWRIGAERIADIFGEPKYHALFTFYQKATLRLLVLFGFLEFWPGD